MQGWTLGKPKLSWSWNLWGMWRSTRRTQKRLRYTMTFFVLFFTDKIYPQDSQVPQHSDCSSTHSKRNRVRNHLRKFKVCESMWAEGMNIKVGNELTNIIAKSLSDIFECLSWLEDVSDDSKMQNVTPVFKKGNQLNLSFWEVCGANSPGSCLQAHEEQESVLKQSAWIY